MSVEPQAAARTAEAAARTAAEAAAKAMPRPAGHSNENWALRNGVHLLVLWAFAIVRPTFDVLSQGPDLFVGRKVDGIEFVIVIVFFALAPPIVLLGLEALAALRSRRLRERLHLIFFWGLLSVFAALVLKSLLPSNPAVLFVGSILVGMVSTTVYARFAPARTFLDYLAPTPVVFLAAFLFFSPAEGLIFQKAPPVATEGVAPRTPVIWVMFDELPVSSLMNAHQRIDAERYPNFGRLARHATWFRNLADSADETEEAIPAMLSGRKPRRDQIPTFTDHPDNLFTYLGGSHAVTAMEPSTWLCPSSICPHEFSALRRMYDLTSAMSVVYANAILPPSVRKPPIGRTLGEALSPDLPKKPIDPETTSSSELARHGDAQFRRFLEQIKPLRRSARPPLAFLYSSVPHMPWNYLPSGKIYASISDSPPGLDDSSGPYSSTWTTDRHLVAHSLQRHLLQTTFADRLLGNLIRHLKRTGLYDHSLIVITSDHGVSFRPGGYRRQAMRDNAGDVGLLPFFVKAPGQTRGRVVNRRIQGIDVLPTLAQVLGVRIPWRVDGTSAFRMSGSGRHVITDFRQRDQTEVRLPFSLLLRERRETVRRQTALFGTGRPTPAFFGIGTYRDLTRMDTSSLNTVPRGELTVALDHASDYGAVDPSAAYLPALVSGEVNGPAASDVHDVAIAVNGRIEAVGPTYDSGGVKFSAMVPDRSLHRGANAVKVYAVTGRPDRAKLLDLGGAGNATSDRRPSRSRFVQSVRASPPGAP